VAEFDLDKVVSSIPVERMKMRRARRGPAPAAVPILQGL
jgi:hypothetical protein